jgi:hypothetical protein
VSDVRNRSSREDLCKMECRPHDER